MRRTLSIALVGAGLLAGCGGGDGGKGDTVTSPPSSAPSSLLLSSPAIMPGRTIPARYTCAGAGTSPPLRWSKIPAAARSLALFVADPDAPGGTFVHWTAWGIRPAAGALPAGAKPPIQGADSAGHLGWTPPCPPAGKPHRYVFTLYALRAPLRLRAGAKPEMVREAISAVALGQGGLTGLYGR